MCSLWGFFAANLILLTCFANRISGFTLAELQQGVPGDLATQTVLNLSSDEPSGSNVRLSGGIPPEIGQLTNLTVLRLSKFQLTGPLPPEIGNLTRLVSLDLSWNNLTGPLPFSLDKLTALGSLNLRHNNISGPVPPWQSLVNLQELDFSNNYLTGPLPAELGTMVSLTKLVLYKNNITGPIPPEIGKLNQLYMLNLFNNMLNGSIPATLGGLQQLQYLGLQGNQLSGSLPPELGGLVSLTDLYVWNNTLTGPLPSSLGNLTQLVNLYLGQNAIEGSIPPSLGQLTVLQNLDLENNSISGTIPGEVGYLSNLGFLGLGVNRLSGSLPSTLGGLASLKRGSFYRNNLTGPIPRALGDLTRIQILYLNENHLSGPVPAELANPPGLRDLQLQSNNLSGTVSAGFVARFGANHILVGNPGLSISGNGPTSPVDGAGAVLPPSGSVNPDTNRSGSSASSRILTAALLGGAGLMLVIAIAGGILLYRRSRKRNPPLSSSLVFSKDWDAHQPSDSHSATKDVSGKAVYQGPPLFREFSLAELRAATDDFSGNNVVGTGSFGTVYRAVLADGAIVAVKRLDQRRTNRRTLEQRSWQREIASLNQVRHKNLVRLLGVCAEDEEQLLVLEYFQGGCLAQRLQAAKGGGTKTLPWEERVAVIKGVASGLAYLHHEIQPPLIHRDVKAGNILLGSGDAAIADFGLAQMMLGEDEPGETSTAAKGTLPYMAPEYVQGGARFLSTKCDVYSFGVLVLEILTGTLVTDWADAPLVVHANRLVNQNRELDLIDVAVRDGLDEREAAYCLAVAMACVQRSPSDRPTMEQVTRRLSALARPRTGSKRLGTSTDLWAGGMTAFLRDDANRMSVALTSQELMETGRTVRRAEPEEPLAEPPLSATDSGAVGADSARIEIWTGPGRESFGLGVQYRFVSPR